MAQSENTENIRQTARSRRSLDDFDRRILGALVEDAEQTYAVLGERVGLSAPAVHDRVRKLRASGHITGTFARLDGPRIGKPVLAYVHVDNVGWGGTEEFVAISALPEVEEIHSVAGDTCMLLKVRCESSRALEGLLAHLYAVPGVKGTRTYIVLSTYLDRPVQAELTDFETHRPAPRLPPGD